MNQSTIERIFRQCNPEYQHRWEAYETVLDAAITGQTVWLDIGCGKNEFVARFGGKARNAIGIDLLDCKDRSDAPFLQADLRHIPLPSGYANLITLRLVVEHLERGSDDLADVCRLLDPGGRLIILTTNSLSPIIFLPRLLPYRQKSWTIQKMFGVASHDIFPTFHRFNSPRKMARGFDDMAPVRLDYLEGVPLDRPFLTLLFAVWYAIAKIPGLRRLRSNLLAVFQKRSI